ncbi:hypothetical protein BD626DRAFT_178732 [Schizophyllum amplum]|uniref:Uncharacterized protein n=1 Tax=Schizophyllum amplum TaxID=97359 RepID=A0A550C1P5_9AGAR|nr:hypothetical protein BD626DRAFT_178732 [Auriculariopsis ampla]
MAPGGERMPLVFRSWDVQEEPRCVSRMEVPFRSGFTWNKAKRQGEQDVVLAIVPALADNFESALETSVYGQPLKVSHRTQFFALGDDGSFRLKCTNSSHGPLRALHGSTVLARHETDHLSLRDYNIDEPRCLIMNPHIVQVRSQNICILPYSTQVRTSDSPRTTLPPTYKAATSSSFGLAD